MNAYTKIKQVAETFPSLKGRQILETEEPHDGQFLPHKFLERVYASGAGKGATDAALFIADLWDGGTGSDREHFDLFVALGSWDADHKAAFLAWVNAPVWP